MIHNRTVQTNCNFFPRPHRRQSPDGSSPGRFGRRGVLRASKPAPRPASRPLARLVVPPQRAREQTHIRFRQRRVRQNGGISGCCYSGKARGRQNGGDGRGEGQSCGMMAVESHLDVIAWCGGSSNDAGSDFGVKYHYPNSHKH